MNVRLSADDILIFAGLFFIGTGLFFWFGRGVALTVTGFLILALGIAANVAAPGNDIIHRKTVADNNPLKRKLSRPIGPVKNPLK